MKPPTLKEQGYLPRRYVVALMSFLGMMCNYMLRVNINLTIVAMVKTSNSTNNSNSAQEVCGFDDETVGGEDFEEGEFEWNEWTQGLITGSFFWGYMWTQIPGGRLSELIGARRVLGIAMILASVLSLLVPLAAKAGPTTLIMVRVLLGLSEGATFPGTHGLLSSWAPPLERSTLSTIIYSGSQAGTLIAFPMAAAIIKSFGWEAVFYIQGSISLVWCATWFLVVPDTPSTDQHITQVERDYIIASIGHTKNKKPPPVPFKSVLTSLPFYAILVANVGNNWGFFTLLTDLPLYMKNMLMKDISSNALLSGLPYLGMLLFSLLVSVVADKLLQSKTLSTTAVRKIVNSIAHMGPAVTLLALTFVECNQEATIALLFVAVTLQGGIYTGFMVNHVDISPNFAGTLFGITNACGTISGWLAPMTVGALTNGQQTFEQWRKVFYISAGIFIADALFFVAFASGRVQEWNYVEQQQQHTIETKEMASLKVGSEKYKMPVRKDSVLNKAYEVYVLNPYTRAYTNQAFNRD